ncbi:MAG: hypothetical protein VXY56_08000, partial [Pseudomonadota bacterium]|nr:hypothetical protein [Pseudomonadota bacterium]
NCFYFKKKNINGFLGFIIKIIPQKTTTSLIHSSDQGLKLDVGAFCFFLLGMFLAAIIFHQIGLF